MAVIALSFLIAPVSFGQSTFGSITGRITDPSGAAIPAAHILLTNQSTGATRHAISNSAGIFDIPSLDLGTYRVRHRSGLRLVRTEQPGSGGQPDYQPERASHAG
ncbi:MAG: carboxypeptidase-like regulatory domain-containing protein [Terriglobia bacterium]